ncbi:MAG: PKD domain-containing protein, partial [Nanoarchaeota archaeon]
MKLPRDTLTFILAVCALLLLISFFSFAAYFASSDIEALNETGQLPSSGAPTAGNLFTNQTPLGTNTTTTQVGGSGGGGGRSGGGGGGGGGSGGSGGGNNNNNGGATSTPSLVIIRPANGEQFNYTTNLPLQITIVNFSATSCRYSLDGTSNVTIANCASTTFAGSEGAHTLNVFASNATNYVLMAQTNFSINTSVASNQPPVAQFTFSPLSGQAPLNVTFNASSSYDIDGTIVAYTWNFGDGANSSGVFAFHTYNTAGNYTVILTVRDNAGANSSATSVVAVSQTGTNLLPVAQFTFNPSSGTAPLNVSFNASLSYDSDGNITSYQWDFGDSSAGSGQIAQHTYNSMGNYTVNLTVQDNSGAFGSASGVIVVTNGTGGTGGGDWINVCTSQELDNVRNNLTANYRQVCDIDLAGYNWLPIGLSDNDPFTGTYDGQNHVIANLNYYNDTGAPRFYGLFGVIFDGELRNLRIGNVSIVLKNVMNANFVGSVAGFVFNTSITNVQVNGLLDTNGSYGTIGGFVGTIQLGAVSDSSASVIVNATRISQVGGFTSSNSGIIINASASGNVYGNSYVGGLVGFNSGTIIDSSASGNVTGDSWVGGLVGSGTGNITGSWARGNVIGYGINAGFIGGLSGSQYRGFINNSFATGNVAARDMNNIAETFVGGLVGQLSSSSIFNSGAYGNVSGYGYVGGLVGHTLYGNISDSSAHGNVNASTIDVSAAMVGGLVGSHYEGFINSSF